MHKLQNYPVSPRQTVACCWEAQRGKGFSPIMCRSSVRWRHWTITLAQEPARAPVRPRQARQQGCSGWLCPSCFLHALEEPMTRMWPQTHMLRLAMEALSQALSLRAGRHREAN